MAQVEAAALRSQSLLHNERNTAIITLTEQLVRALHGGRVTSCKSAKDRTSMAVTAEQVRWLVERHGLDADEAPAVAAASALPPSVTQRDDSPPAARSEPSDAAGRKRPREAAADNSEPAVYRSMGAVSAYLKGKQASSGAGE